jgi:hypothetical protein
MGVSRVIGRMNNPTLSASRPLSTRPGDLEASMLARHVVVNGDMGANGGTSCMGCNSAPFVEDLDGAGSDADVDRMYSKASTTGEVLELLEIQVGVHPLVGC